MNIKNFIPLIGSCFRVISLIVILILLSSIAAFGDDIKIDPGKAEMSPWPESEIIRDLKIPAGNVLELYKANDYIKSGSKKRARLGWIENGGWAKYGPVDFGQGGIRTFKARVSSNTKGGYIRINTSDEGFVGKCVVRSTGDWEKWKIVSCNLTRNVTGIQYVTLKFSGRGSGWLFNIDWIEFSP